MKRAIQKENMFLLAVMFLLMLVFSSCVKEPTPAPQISQLSIQATNTQSPTQTTKPLPTKAIVSGCVFVSSLRVRSGPGTEYGLVDGLSVGDCVDLDARNEASTWARIQGTDNWVAFEFIDAAKSLVALPVVKARVVAKVTGPNSVETSPPISTPISTSTVPSPTKKPVVAFIPSNEARAHIGENVTVRINRAYCEFIGEVSATFCNDQPFPNHDFTMLKWDKDWSFYNGACLLVTGRITPFRGEPQIVVKSQSQVATC